MKVHYFNILCIVLPLNILVSSPTKNPSIAHHTPKIPTNRSLCECELYAPANYDNDPQMKRVMENFNKQTQQRFHEYDERMQEKRKECKERCDKEIQKIILKDKLEKELMDKFATLQTDIQSDAIPTCVCENSIADKVEKGCLRCGGVFGGGIAPSVGVLGGIGEAAISAWKVAALKVAFAAARKAGVAKGLAAGNARGVEIVTYFLEQSSVKALIPEIWEEISSINHYNKVINFAELIFTKKSAICSVGADSSLDSMCLNFDFSFGIRIRTGTRVINGPPGSEPVINTLNGLVEKAKLTATTEAADVISTTTPKIINEKTAVINTIYMGKHSAIIASIVAIVVIVLIMVIIYLILRYRRKKKMKKKLQYIKLLEE
ncbi:rifin PIR protein, putative [Plasmodium reichenowi]|uniref:Rifin PIR protein, putative n=1 Tax=Plasmodium reichenowi TaxID=5854 RepID=A0A2P9D4Y2_PLARE|nr:rifin PIR protein, putative [Plasmodium reichenowi]